MSGSQTSKNDKFRRTREDQTHTRHCVSNPSSHTTTAYAYTFRHAVRVNPQFSNRMIEASRSILNRYIPDIYLYSDVYKGEESGKSVHVLLQP